MTRKKTNKNNRKKLRKRKQDEIPIEKMFGYLGRILGEGEYYLMLQVNVVNKSYRILSASESLMGEYDEEASKKLWKGNRLRKPPIYIG